MSGQTARFRFQLMNIRDRLASETSPGDTPWLLIKTIIRGSTVLLALISIGCFAIAIPLWNKSLVHTGGLNKGDWQDGIPIAPLSVALFYNLGTTIYAMKTAKRVPYIIEMMVDFLVWAALAPALVFTIWGGVFNVWERAVVDDSGMIMCTLSSNYYSRECAPELYPIGMLELGGIAFAVPVGMLQIFLSVHGVFERCKRSRRTQQRAAEMVKSLEEGSGYDYGRVWNRQPPMPQVHVYS